jgi:radical SAM family uncharacterized protein/radical SAM-linked protein
MINLDQLITSDIQRPARYLGKEMGSAHRHWESAQVRWVLSYPEVYEVGASNLGHIILYNILNAHLDQLCDRVYLPGSDLIVRMRQQGIPLFAVESRRPLQEFHLIGFSLAYELGGTNVLEMLDLARIPLTWVNRNAFSIQDCPLIFAGGPTATSNPEPFADFFDFFVLGDGEEVLPEIGAVVKSHLHQSRREILFALAQVAGVYVPQFYDGLPLKPLFPGIPKRIQRRVAMPKPEYSVGLVPYVSTVHDRLVMEVRRGCTRGCRFCQPGMLTRPARDVDPDQLVNAVTEGIRQTGYDEFSLSSLSCSDYLSLPAVGAELQNRFRGMNIGLSLPSQRVDRFDDQIAQVMGGTRRPSLTFAPEAGTQRLRDIINKGLTDADLIQGITTAVRQGWEKIKLYFIIGLPGETDEDVIGIANTLGFLKRACAEIGHRYVQFTLTISNFTPKPHTPFQWHRVDYEDLRRKQKLLQKHLRGLRGVKAHCGDIRFAILEDLIGKGDRSLGQMIYRAWKQGAGQDGWFENIDTAYAAWVQAYQNTDLPPETTTDLPLHTFAITDPLPWDHIDTGIDKAWLQKDYQRALDAITVADCSFASCSACGVCGSDFGHNIALPALPTFAPVAPPVMTPPARRFRIQFSKQGDLRWLGHLDLMRLWERACRRAGVSLAFTKGFRPTPRLSLAHALPVGVTSWGEILDLELLPPLNSDTLKQALQDQLPEEIQIQSLTEIPLHAPSATALLTAAEYRLLLQAEGSDLAWQDWIQGVWDAQDIELQRMSKNGKTRVVNGRNLLLALELQESFSNGSAWIFYRGWCRNDGSFLRPLDLVTLLQAKALTPLTLKTTERLRLILGDDM